MGTTHFETVGNSSVTIAYNAVIRNFWMSGILTSPWVTPVNLPDPVFKKIGGGWVLG